MFRPIRLLHVVILASLATFVLGQGGAAGFGQGQAGGAGAPSGGGFGGGGFRGRRDGAGTGTGTGTGTGGGYGEAYAAYDKKAKPDEDPTQGLWETRTAILTPGDRVEFKLNMKKGETLLAGATSDAFDPALSVEDSKGTVLLKNDDREEGDQSPFVVYRFPEAGTYLLKVLSYHSVSGGKFTLKMRTFVSADGQLGKVRHDNVPTIDTEGYGVRAVFRLTAKKGKIYDLRSVRGITDRNLYGCNLLRIVGPTGVEAKDFHIVPTRDYQPVMEALADGDFYLEYTTINATQFETDYREVTVVAGKATMDQQIDLDAGELKIVEFPVTPNRIIRTTLSGVSLLDTLSAPAADAKRFDESSDESHGNNRFWLWFKSNVDSDREVVRVFHGGGTARYAIRSGSNSPQKLGFKNAEALPVWSEGDAAKDSIEIGDTRLFLIKSTKSELMRVAATATHFQTRLDIFRLNGDLANSLCDRSTHKSGDDLYFPEADTFLVRISCDGHGGSGDYSMKREVLKPAPYTLGTAQTLKLDGVNFGLYSVNLEAGKRYQLMTDQPGKAIRADLLDDDGQFLTSRGLAFDKVAVQYFIPTKSGRHRLWLRGDPGERHFKFELHVPPSIGG